MDMDPPYQRQGRIWTQYDKQYLIDSIINEYDIPKIYLADFSIVDTELNAKRMIYAVIDGKQRLEAIFDFFDNRFALHDRFMYEDDPALSLGGHTYSDLRAQFPQIAEIIDNFNLSIMSVITDDEAKINELFVRLNNSKPLTGAEIRNAMQGVVPSLIRTISEHDFFTRNVRFQTKRGQDKNAAAKLLLTEFRGRFVDIKRIQLDAFVREQRQSDAQPGDFERAADRVNRVLNRMSEAFGERDALLTSQGPLPVYYWLARELDLRETRLMRSFLISFDRNVKRTRTAITGSAVHTDLEPDIVAYIGYSRNANDQGSLEGRFEILVRQFRLWLKRRTEAQLI